MKLVLIPSAQGSLGKNPGCEKAPEGLSRELENALTAFQYAAQRRRGDAMIINSISNIESELRGESSDERP